MADENPVTTNRSLSNDANPMANFASGDRNVDSVSAFHQDGNNSMSKPNVDDPSQQFNPYNHARLNPNFPAPFYPGMYPYPPQGMFPEYDRNFSANMYDRERWLAANRFPGPAAVNGSGHHWPPGGGPTSGGVGEDWMAGNDGRGMNAMPSHPWMGGMPFYPQIPGSNMMNRFDLSGFPPHGVNYPKPGDASSAGNALNSPALSQMPARFGGPNESQFDAQHQSDRASKDGGADSGISAQGMLDENTGEYISGDGAQQKPKSGAAKKKKKRKRSESEDAGAGGSEQPTPPKAAKKSKKKKMDKAAEGEGSGAENAGEENASTAEDGGETKPPKPKRIRKKKPKATGADSAEGKKQAADELRKEAIRKKYYERRNIRTIKESETLASETKDAQKEEQERLRRLEERKEMHMQQQNEQATSELKSLLECEDISEAKEDEDVILLDEKKDAPEVSKTEAEVKPAPSKDVVEILSSEDEDDEVKKKKQNSSSSDLGNRTLEDLMKEASSKKGEGKEEEEVDEGPDDPDNSGSHVNDLLNVPDSQGRVLVNTGHPADDPDVFLAPQIAAMIKPHQIGGIRFMYDNLVESVKQFKASTGFGCILAHSMGLGKTVQVIGFIDVFMRSTGARTVLVIVPVNTLQNWVHEFNMWLPRAEDVPEEIPREELQPRPFDVHVITDSCRSQMARANIVDKWSKNGGVLIVGYEMFRLLTTKVTNVRPKRSRKKNADPVVIDVEEEEKTKELLKSSYDALIKPGPDLVICDEGHRIKNCAAGISRALKDIRTKRRVVMTGYPLQNNLQEYWCMVDFVRPNFLGSRMEFSNMFERPIMNGQCVDSTPADIKIMRYRAHVLHSLLLGFVQRRSHSVLQYSLPPKDEYVLLIRLSPIQRKLYNEFIHMIEDQSVAMWASKNPIKAFAVCCKIWNHPDIIYKVLKSDKKVGMAIDNDLDIDDVDAVSTSKVKVGNKKAVVGSEVKDDEEASVAAEEEEEEEGGDAGCFKKPHPALPPSLLPDASSVSLSSKFSDSDADSMLDLSMLRDADMDMPDLEEKLLGDALERGADGMLVCDEKATGSPLRDSKSGIVEGSGEVKVKDTAPVAVVKMENKDITEAKNVLWTLNGDDSSCDSKSEAGSSISNLPSAATVSVKSEGVGLAALVDNGSSCDFKPNIGAVKEEIKAELSPPKLSSMLNGDSTANIEMKKPTPAKIGTATENHSLMHLLSDDPSDEVADAAHTDTLTKAPLMTAAALRPSASCPVIPVAAAGFNKATIKPGLASSASLDEAGKPTPSGSEKKMQNVISYDWAADLLRDYKEGLMECGPKVALLRHLLDECVLAGDKMLVFSQSLLTLSLIEEFLNHWTVPGRDYTWAKNKSYFRLDGGTSTAEREKMINQFNDASNDRVLLFLLSTRAGSLGINLIGANRVVVFDASWNPCHDAQAVCRVYRYGQYKHCYIYRFVADGTMEKKIYDRQVNKEGISNRVVDELNPTHFLTKRQVDLLNFEEKEQSKGVEDCDWSEKFGDAVLCKALSANHQWLSAMPFKHEALLTDRLEERLSKAEKRKARESYEMEKRMGMAGSRPSVGGYRTIGTVPGMMLGVGGRMTTFNRPVASIRPMMSNPVAGGNRPVSVRPDVVVQQIHTTTDIIIPNSSGGDGVKKIPRGEKVILIKTPKGVYMRTNEGKIYAVRTAGKTTSTSGDSATTSSASITTSAGSSSSATAVTSVLASATASTSKADGLTSLVTKVGGGANVTLVKKEGGVTRTLPSGAIVLRMPVPSNGPGVRLQGASLVHSTMGKRTVSVYKIASTTATTLNLANCIKASSKMGAMRPAASSSSLTTVTTASVAKKEGELSDADAVSTSAPPAADGGEGAGEDGIASTEDGVDKLAVGKNEAWKNKLMVPVAPVNRVVTAMASSDPTNQAASVADGMTGLSSLLTSSGGTVRSVSSTAPPTPSVGNWQQALDITTDKSVSQLPTVSTAEPSTSASIISLNKQDKVSPVKVIEITTKPLGGVVNKGAAASNSAAKPAVVAATLSPADSDQPGEKAKKKRYPKKKKDAETVDNDSLSEPPIASAAAAAKPARKRSPKKPAAGVTLQQPVAMETDVQRSPADGVKTGGQMPAWQQPQQQQQLWQNQQQPPLTSLASPPAQGQGQQMKTAPQQGPSSGGMGHPQQMLMQQQSRPFGQGEGQPEMDPSRSRLGSWSMQQQGDVHGRPGDWQQQQQQQQRSEMPPPPDMQRQSSAIDKGPARSEFESVFSSLLQPDDYWGGGHNSHNAAGTGAWDPWTTPRPGQQQQQQHSVNRSDGWPKENSNVGSAWHQPTPSHQQQQQQQSSVIDLDSWQQQHSANSGPGEGGRKLSSTDGSLHGQQQAADPLARGDSSFSGSMSQFRAPEYPVPGAYDQRWAPSYMGGNQMAPAPPAPSSLGMAAWQHPWMAASGMTAPAPSYGASPYGAYPSPYYSNPSATDYMGFGATGGVPQGAGYMHSNLPGYPYPSSHAYPPYGTPGYPWPGGRNGPD